MPTWIRSFLLYALLLLGMSWALPASASPGSDVGCGAIPTSSKTSAGGDVCADSYPSSSNSSSLFLPGTNTSSGNLSHWIHLSPAYQSSAAASFTTPSSVIVRAVGALASDQCSVQASPSSMYCHEVTTSSGLHKLVHAFDLPSEVFLQVISQYSKGIAQQISRLPVSDWPILEELAPGFGLKSTEKRIDDFVFPHPIQVCTDASTQPSGDGYVPESSSLVKSKCTKTGTDLWVCHSSFATKLSDKEKAALKAKKRKDIRALEKSMKAHGVPRVKYNNCDLHHIVPNDAHGEDFDEARDLMDKCGIDLNNYQNGVYVPGYRSDQGNCQGGYNHKSLHTKKYAKELLDKLKEGYGTDNDCDGLEKALQEFKEKLQNGSGDYPKTDTTDSSPGTE